MRVLESLRQSYRTSSRYFRRYYRPLYGSVGVGIVVTLFVLLVLQALPVFVRAELSTYDFYFMHRTDSPKHANIAIVELDNASVSDLNNAEYPIPRRFMASAINYLHLAGAQTIGLDFEYVAPSTKRDDTALAAAIKRAGNVVLVDTLGGELSNSNVSASVELTPPIDALANVDAGAGVANVPLDDDGKLRAVDLTQAGPGGSNAGAQLYPSFATEVASVALHKPWQDVVRGLPQHMLINYVGPQDPGDSSRQTLPRYQFENLVVPPLPPAKLFRNKIVLIIPYATITKDLFETPFGTMYGGSAQANALNTILNRDPILPLGNNGNSLILLIVGLITTIAASRFGIWRSTAATVGVAAAFALLGFVWIDHFNVWMNVVTPEATVVLVFAGIMSLRFATEERQRRKLSKKFGLYVKPEIVDILMNSHDEEAALKPTRRPISILFVDVRGFTAMSEQMEPEDVVDALDVYLEELTASVQRFDGTVNKYVGDELVAVWNAPMSQDNHAMLSVKCGLDMVSRMETINRKLRAKGRPAIAYGIGINSGDAVVGEMGSSFRVQYDVIGDTVNTGARLCSAAGRGEIIVGEYTWQVLGDRLVVEETEPLKLKGKGRPFRTFRLVDIIERPEAVPEVVPAPV